MCPITEYFQELSVTTKVLLTLVSAVVIYFSITKLKELLAWYAVPGPWGLPIVGYYPFLRHNAHIQLTELCTRYGDIYGFNVAGQYYIHLGSEKAVKETIIKQPDSFPSRNHKFGLIQFAFQKGLIYLEGENWKVLRKFFTSAMRDVGIKQNKATLQTPLEDAVQSVLKALEESKGQTVYISDLLRTCFVSLICRLVLGHRVSDDIAKRITTAHERVVIPEHGKNILLMGSLPRYFILPFVEGYADMFTAYKEESSLMASVIQDDKANIDMENPETIAQMYYKEKRLLEKKGDRKAAYFTDEALRQTMLQLFGDGVVGNCINVSSFLKEVSKRKDIQDVIYEEIKREIGTDRLPTWDDRVVLKRSYSILKELFRTSDLFPLFPSLVCERDTKALGVNIPKGTTVLLNSWAIQHDSSVHKNPYKFDTDRYVAENNQDYSAGGHFYTFGAGRRACLGEGLVSISSFLFLTSVLQKFSLKPVDNSSNKTTFEEVFDFYIKATPR